MRGTEPTRKSRTGTSRSGVTGLVKSLWFVRSP